MNQKSFYMASREAVMAGFSEIDITPVMQVELIGFNRPDSRSQGVHTRLMAQTLLLQRGKERFLLVAVDNLGLTIAKSARIRKKLAALLNTVEERVMLCFSHTHAAPLPDRQGLHGEEYLAFLTEKLLSCARRAAESLVPCHGGWGVTRAALGVNRRAGCTALDDRLGVLKLVRADNGAPVATLLRVTAHANVLKEDNCLISSDYFGAVRSAVAARYGGGVMLAQGAAGNVRPAHEGILHCLTEMADEVLRALEQLEIETGPIDRLKMWSVYPRCASDVPTREQALQIARRAMTECGIDGSAWLREVDALRERGVTVQSMVMETQFFVLDGGTLCGIPNEPFCEIGLDIWKRTGDELLFFGGYTNACDSYFPHREEWQKGGYEILYSYLLYYIFHGRVMPLREETADAVAALVTEEWEKKIRP